MGLKKLLLTPGVVPICLQLKEQVKWLIATEQLAPGGPLPSVRDLSETLGIARNTINAVYDELRDEGLVTMGRGRGTEVAATEQVRQLTRLKGLLELIDGAFASALQAGFTPAEIAPAAQVRAHLLLAEAPAADDITLVECCEHEVEFYLRQIRELTGRRVRLLDLDAFRQHPVPGAGPLVTSCFHACDVRELLGAGADVEILGAHPDMAAVLQVAQLPAGSRILFVGRSRRAGEWVRRIMADAGLTHLEMQAVGVDEAEFGALAAGATALFALPSIYGRVTELAPDPTAVRRVELVLDTGSRERLKRFSRAE